MRQQAFLHADQIDVRKFQPLGRVQGHQCDGVAIQFRFFVAGFVALAEGNFVEKYAQRRFLRSFFKCRQRIDHFLHRGPARLQLVRLWILPR